MAQDNQQGIDQQYLQSRSQDENASVDQLVQSKLQAQPSAPGPPTPQQEVDAMPSSAFASDASMTGFSGILNRSGLTSGIPLLQFFVKNPKLPEPNVAEHLVGQGFLSGIEKEAVATLQSRPALALMVGSSGLATIPRIAAYGGSRLLSAFFGLQMGQALWQKNKEYQKSLQDEGGLGPQSREILGRMTVLAALGIKAGQHALGESLPPSLRPPAPPEPGTVPITPENLATQRQAATTEPIPTLPAGASEQLRVNLKYIDAADSTKAVIADINRMNATPLAGSRATQSHAVTIEQSKSALTIEQALAVEPGAPLHPGEMLALRDLRDSAATHVDNLAKATLSGDVDAAQQLKSAVSLAGQLESLREQSSRTAARTLESHKIMSDASRPALSPSDIAGIASNFSNTVDTDPVTLAKMLQALPRQDQRIDFLRQVADGASKGVDILHEAWMNWGLLSGPQTHAAKVTSESAMIPWSIGERTLAAQIRGAQRLFGAEGPGVEQGEPLAMARGIVDGWSDGLRAAGKIITSGQDPQSTFGEPNLSREKLNLSNGTAVGNAINLIYHLPTRALSAESSFFKGVNYSMELKAQAVRQASAEGLEGADFAARVAEIENNPPASIKDAADQFKLIQTFQAELGPVGQAFNKLRNAIPGGRFIQPFLRVVANIATQAGQRVPGLSLLSRQNWEDFNAGGAKRDLALARVTSGALTAAAIATIYEKGLAPDAKFSMTGGGPTDKVLRDMNTASGRPPYSFIVNGKAYSYNRVEPFGAMIGAIADYMEINSHVPEEDQYTMANAIVLALGHNMMSKTYTQGVSNWLDALSQPDKKMQSLMESYARTVVPSVVRTINRQEDPIVRAVNSTIDAIKASTPGWSKTLPPQQNIFGEPIQVTPGLGPDILSPVYTNNQNDPVAKELVRAQIADRLTMPAKTLFGSAPPDVRMQPERVTEGIPLRPFQYATYVGLAGNDLKIGGKGMKETLAKLFSTPEYQRQSDGPDGGKSVIVRAIVSQFRQAAQAEMLQRSDIKQMLVERMIGRAHALTPQSSQPQGPGRIAIAQ